MQCGQTVTSSLDRVTDRCQEGRQVSSGQHAGAATPTHTFTLLGAASLLNFWMPS